MGRKKLSANEFHDERKRGSSAYLHSQYEEEIQRLADESRKYRQLLRMVLVHARNRDLGGLSYEQIEAIEDAINQEKP